MSTQFSIPGNIKQQMLPFVLNPDSALNLDALRSTALTGNTGAQWFTFRNRNPKDFPSGLGRIQICPSSLTNPNFGSYFDKDISNMLLYGPNGSKKSITLNDIFNQMPSVQIREFLPDTKMDQLINLISDIFESLWDVAKTLGGGVMDTIKAMIDRGGDMKEKMNFLMDMMSEAFYFATGKTKPSFMTDKNGRFRFQDPNDTGIFQSSGLFDNKQRIVDFPYMMYYKLQSYVTTNVYEIPAMMNEKTVFSSDGSKGWTGGKGFGATSLTDGILGKVPTIKKIVDNMLGNVQINWMPLWDPIEGSAVPHPKATIKFDLFNDTDEAAMMNFIFVNTLVPNNMYIQYGMFQHSSSLYDVRIAGFDRMFACSGNTSVQYSGVVRNPTDNWVWRLVSKYANKNPSKENPIDYNMLYSSIVKNNLIKIPDIYQVQMDFESLLPNNFNSYLFNFTHNMSMEYRYKENRPYYSAILGENNIKGICKDFKDYMQAWSKDYTAKKKAVEDAKKKEEEENARKKKAEEEQRKYEEEEAAYAAEAQSRYDNQSEAGDEYDQDAEGEQNVYD